MENTIVIVGASGFIGHALHEHLVRRSYSVVTVDRKATKGGFSWEDPWESKLEGARGVINLAGAPITLPWTSANQKLIVDSRVDSAKRIAKAISECPHPPLAWINASAVGFYGDRGDSILGEEASAGTGFLSSVTVQWEAAVQEAQVRVRRAWIRTGIALGPDGGALEPLAKLAKVGLGGHLGSGQQWMSWIDVRDLCALYEWAVTSSVEGPINGVSPEPIRNTDFMRLLRGVVHRPWSPPAPGFALGIAAKFGAPDPSILLDSVRAVPECAARRGFRFEHAELVSVLKDSLRPA
jgi:uncharacterized protein (TIGR01777 family)